MINKTMWLQCEYIRETREDCNEATHQLYTAGRVG